MEVSGAPDSLVSLAVQEKGLVSIVTQFSLLALANRIAGFCNGYSRASHSGVFANDPISRHHMIVMPCCLSYLAPIGHQIDPISRHHMIVIPCCLSYLAPIGTRIDLILRHHMIVMPVALVIWLQMAIKLIYPPTFCASFAECVVLIHSVVLSGDHDYVVCM